MNTTRIKTSGRKEGDKMTYMTYYFQTISSMVCINNLSLPVLLRPVKTNTFDPRSDVPIKPYPLTRNLAQDHHRVTATLCSSTMNFEI